MCFLFYYHHSTFQVRVTSSAALQHLAVFVKVSFRDMAEEMLTRDHSPSVIHNSSLNRFPMLSRWYSSYMNPTDTGFFKICCFHRYARHLCKMFKTFFKSNESIILYLVKFLFKCKSLINFSIL